MLTQCKAFAMANIVINILRTRNETPEDPESIGFQGLS